MTELAPHLSAFLRQHLPRVCNASRHTIASYADSFILLVRFAAGRLDIRPSEIAVEQLTPNLILDFLDHLEEERGNSVGTRNVRLAAIKSFFRYLEYRVASCLDPARQVRAIPLKRRDEPLVNHLDRDEVRALLHAPDPRTPAGLRDRAMIHLAYGAGLRVSELVAVRIGDLAQPHFDTVRVVGKGRRERELPLWKETRSVIRDWLAIRPQVREHFLFLNARGVPISRHGFAHRLALHVCAAARKVPSMGAKRITPHTLRHSCAIHTLEATGDIRKVSLWLGHSSLRSTEIYLRSDPIGKFQILADRLPPSIARGSFPNAPDGLISILQDARTVP